MTLLCVPEAVICRIFFLHPLRNGDRRKWINFSNDLQKEEINSEKQPKRFYSIIYAYIKKISNTSAQIKKNLRTPSN